ncbi:flagellar assembly protein FliH [Marinobacterium nitratireducens]|uniref:Flagellar assembly protein FliH n=1 Tax=Marinobacterium nitratireducens TaxID=518897 RepID=A0A918DWI4_9GAMM|nr:flagellar assembly protein FliH [Marinobacterium nitratireducens]GGO84983.1 flagellar assembly protein FliH [Marinobacterium nitratireducens]
MSQSDKPPVRIRAADVGAVELWRLPQVEGRHRVALVQREESAVDEQLDADELPFGDGKLTLAELERIREEARQEGFEEGHREGFDKGLEAGRMQGHDEGLQQGQQEIAAAVARLDEMISEFEAPLQTQARELESCLLRMVVQLAAAVTRHELVSRPELILDSVREALALLPDEAGDVRIHVNPENEVLLQPLCDAREHRTLVPDPGISAGGCRVRTPASRVDQTLETRFGQVAEQLLARLAESPGDE